MAPRTPLFDPLEYFQRRGRPSLSLGTGIVFLQAFLLVMAVWLFTQQVLARIDFPAGVDPGSASIGDDLFYFFLMMVAGWLLVAAVLHVFVWFSDGDRGFGTTLAIVGEAELVGLVLFPVAVFVLFSAVGQVPSDPDAALPYLRDTAGLDTPLLNVAGFVGTIWRAYIAGYGLSVAQGMSREKAFVLSFAVGLLGYLIGLAG